MAEEREKSEENVSDKDLVVTRTAPLLFGMILDTEETTDTHQKHSLGRP